MWTPQSHEAIPYGFTFFTNLYVSLEYVMRLTVINGSVQRALRSFSFILNKRDIQKSNRKNEDKNKERRADV